MNKQELLHKAWVDLKGDWDLRVAALSDDQFIGLNKAGELVGLRERDIDPGWLGYTLITKQEFLDYCEKMKMEDKLEPGLYQYQQKTITEFHKKFELLCCAKGYIFGIEQGLGNPIALTTKNYDIRKVKTPREKFISQALDVLAHLPDSMNVCDDHLSVIYDAIKAGELEVE